MFSLLCPYPWGLNFIELFLHYDTKIFYVNLNSAGAVVLENIFPIQTRVKNGLQYCGPKLTYGGHDIIKLDSALFLGAYST
jgi:hypothetical protein